MSKPSLRGKPLPMPPSEQTISRSARSFMSTTRRHEMRRASSPRALPWWMWLSRSAASRLLAAPMAWKSPVKCRLMSSIGTTLRMAAARRSALHPEARTEAGLAQADQGLPADPVQPVGESDRGGGLAFAGRGPGSGDRGDQHELSVFPAGERIDVVEVDLRLRMPVGQQCSVRDTQPVADLGDRLLRRLPGNLDVALGQRFILRVDSWSVGPDASGRKAVDPDRFFRPREDNGYVGNSCFFSGMTYRGYVHRSLLRLPAPESAPACTSQPEPAGR